MTTEAVTGPIVIFRAGVGSRPEGGRVAYDPPRSTTDPRWIACTDHHVACDCREAEFAEDRHEHQLIRQETQAAFDAHLAGHPTYAEDEASSCQCTGCQIARAAHIYPKESV